MTQITFDSDFGMIAMTEKAADAWHWATAQGITDEQPSEIFETVMQQEIVSFCTSAGTVSFDTADFVEA